MTFRRFGFDSTIGLLRFAQMLTAVSALAVLFYIVTDVKPVIRFRDDSSFQFADLDKGIPLPVKVNFSIPDSTAPETLQVATQDSSVGLSAKRQALTIFRVFHSSDKTLSEPHAGSVREVVLESGKMYVEPKSVNARIVLCFPLLFYLVAATFGIWQIDRLLNDVLDDKPFHVLNSRRLRNVGWIIISNQAVLCCYYVVSGYWSVTAKYAAVHNSAGNPLPFSFKLNYDFSFTWLILGIMLLIISAAFKNGSLLQEEQDLTV